MAQPWELVVIILKRKCQRPGSSAGRRIKNHYIKKINKQKKHQPEKDIFPLRLIFFLFLSDISDKYPSLTVGGRKNGYTLDFIRAVAIFCFVTICAIFLLIPVLTVSFL